MTVRERVIASRLIMKIDAQGSYAEQIGLSYEVKPTEKTVSTSSNGMKQDAAKSYLANIKTMLN